MRWIRQPAAAPLHLCDIAAAPHTQKHLLRSPGQDASTPRPALHAPQRHSRLATATQKHLTPPRVHSRRPLSGLPAPAPPRYLRAAPPPELRADPRTPGPAGPHPAPTEAASAVPGHVAARGIVGAPPPPRREGELPSPECPAAGAGRHWAGRALRTPAGALSMRVGARLVRRVEPGGRWRCGLF